MLIEDKAAGYPVAQEIRRLYAREKWGVQLVTPTLDKIARAHAVVHLFAEKMVWAPGTQWAQDVINECGSFPKAAHDDRVDSVTMAVKWLRDNGMA